MGASSIRGGSTFVYTISGDLIQRVLLTKFTWQCDHLALNEPHRTFVFDQSCPLSAVHAFLEISRDSFIFRRLLLSTRPNCVDP